MPVEFRFEQINNRDEQAGIERTVLAALDNPDEHWKVTVIGLRSGHACIVDVHGPGIRLGVCYQAQPGMLSNIENDIKRLASHLGSAQSLS